MTPYLLCSSQHINNWSNLTPNSEGSPMAQMVKNPPTMQETRVQSLGWEDPLEKGMATHSSILAWRIPWTEKPDGLQSMGWQRVRHNWAIFTFHTQFIVARHSDYLPSTTLLTCSWLHLICFSWASLMAQLVKNLPAKWETRVRSLGWEDPLERGKGTHSSILAWRIPWPVQPVGLQRVRHHWAAFTFTFASITGSVFSLCLSSFTGTVLIPILLFWTSRFFH